MLNVDRNINKDELTKACKVSEALLRDMVKKNIIREEVIKKLPTPDLKNALKVSKYEKNKKLLNSHQLSAVKKINDSIKGNKSECFLLDGVPGSGKTETYFESVKASHL